MYRTVYVSSNSRIFSQDDIKDILDVSRANNARRGITGALLYHQRNFMQILEGDRETIEALYDRIKEDPRHKHVIQLLAYDCEDRLFADWSMGYVNPGELDSADEQVVQGIWSLCARLGGAEQPDPRIRTLVRSFTRSFGEHHIFNDS